MYYTKFANIAKKLLSTKRRKASLFLTHQNLVSMNRGALTGWGATVQTATTLCAWKKPGARKPVATVDLSKNREDRPNGKASPHRGGGKEQPKVRCLFCSKSPCKPRLGEIIDTGMTVPSISQRKRAHNEVPPSIYQSNDKLGKKRNVKTTEVVLF